MSLLEVPSSYIFIAIIASTILISLYVLLLSRRSFTQLRRSLLAPGEILYRKYRLGHELGRGMNAITFQVEDVENPEIRLVAKVLLTPEEEPRITPDSFRRHIERFRREMSHLQQLKNCMYVVPVYHLYPDAIPPFFVMEYCEGSLKDEVDNTPIAIQKILDVVADVCEGLLASHRLNIIHRDIKPANILRYKEHWVLADFGMSLLGEQGRVVTVPESLPGTVPYTAPEVMYYNSRSIKPSADIFSLGVTLKEMLTGSNVWEGRTSSLLQTRIEHTTIKETELFDKLITEMTSLRPEDRPQTIKEVIQRLEMIFVKVNDMRSQTADQKTHPLLEGLDRFSKLRQNM